jgi:diguanylate cyclase (GGDEF)-like protein
MKSHLLLIDNDPIQAKVKRSTLLKYFDVDLCTNLAIAKQHIEQRTNSGINAYHKPYELVIIDLLPIRQKTIDLHELYKNILPEQYPPLFVATHQEHLNQYIKQLPYFTLDIVLKPIAIKHIELRVNALLSDRKAARYCMHNMVFDDATQRQNMSFFLQHLSKCWMECMRAQKPISLLVLNIDYFALLERCHGKEHAIYVLQVLTVILQSVVFRQDDVSVLSRRDDFYVLLPACSEKGAQLKMKRINQMVAMALVKHDISPISPYISVSIASVTHIPKALSEISVFVDLARARLGLAKQARDSALDAT